MSSEYGRLLRWLGCADEAILAHCPTESMRFAATGATVLTTSALATVSATLTVNQFLHVALLGAVVVGVGWGAAIMALDRWLILARRLTRKASQVWLFATRFDVPATNDRASHCTSWGCCAVFGWGGRWGWLADVILAWGGDIFGGSRAAGDAVRVAAA